MRSPQEVIRSALASELGNAQDNLFRARSAFKRYSPTSMNKPYGQSDDTPQQILDGYTEHVEELSAALKWLAKQEA